MGYRFVVNGWLGHNLTVLPIFPPFGQPHLGQNAILFVVLPSTSCVEGCVLLSHCCHLIRLSNFVHRWTWYTKN